MNNKKVFDFIGYRKVLFLIPIVIAVITVIFNCIFGIEMAIEFKGGTMLTYSYTGEIDTNAVKKTVEGENYGAVTVTTGSSMNSSLEVVEISFSSSEGLTADKQTALSDKLQQTFKDNSLTLVNSQDVNPTSGTEFFLKCLVAVLFSFVLLVIYIAFRFKKNGGLSAGVCAPEHRRCVRDAHPGLPRETRKDDNNEHFLLCTLAQLLRKHSASPDLSQGKSLRHGTQCRREIPQKRRL